MEYSILGRTGARVSHLGFGGAVLGLKDYLYQFDPQRPDDRAKLFEAVDTALEAGINLFDTAPGYGAGESERILGEALDNVAHAAGESLFISTKISHDPRLTVRQSLEQSLSNLRRDHVDLLQIHGDSYSTEDVDRILSPGGRRRRDRRRHRREFQQNSQLIGSQRARRPEDRERSVVDSLLDTTVASF